LTTVSLAKHAKRGQIIIYVFIYRDPLGIAVVVVTVIVVYLVLAFSVNAKKKNNNTTTTTTATTLGERGKQSACLT